MKIIDLIHSRTTPFVSFEFFPPKEKDAWPAFFAAADRLRAVDPLFVSVTYGAGGGTQANTLDLVVRLKDELSFEPMAHLTCVKADAVALRLFLDGLATAGVDNVLALRGDPPKGETDFRPDSEEFRHASDLVSFIKAGYPEMGVGVAAYPEKHPQAASLEEDMGYLKRKLRLGGDFAVTQLFFDNQRYFDFVKKAGEMGMDKPILPGVLPVMNLGGLKRILSLCGAGAPEAFLRELEEAETRGGAAAVAEVGVAYAKRQAKELLDMGAPGVHLYTLNKAEACLEIVEALGI